MMEENERDILIEIRSVLLGANGDTGLVGDVKELKDNCIRINCSTDARFYDLTKKTDANRNKINWIVGVLTGTGILAGTSIPLVITYV